VVIYPDTSFLVSLYVDEEDTKVAEAFAETLGEPLLFTPFHRLEFRTALRVRVFRKNLSLDNLNMAFRDNEEDLAQGILQHTPLVWADTLREAERLGEAYLTETGVRSGDLLHIASAVVLGAREFVTFDQRQTALARRAGLKVKAWRRKK
jgi:predicted nucleic acid-binding protein